MKKTVIAFVAGCAVAGAATAGAASQWINGTGNVMCKGNNGMVACINSDYGVGISNSVVAVYDNRGDSPRRIFSRKSN
jgi:hypothetical protein